VYANTLEPVALTLFNIEKYNPCKFWTSGQWLRALSERSQLRYFLRTNKDKLIKEPLRPEIMVGVNEHFLQVAEMRLADPLDITGGNTISVVPAILRDFSLSDSAYAESVFGNGQAPLDRRTRLRDVVEGESSASHMFYIAVDLDASDTVIKQKFSNWLDQTRRHSGYVPRYPDLGINEQTLLKWANQRLLAYLDLIFWSKLSRHQLTQDQIGKKLYPRVEDASDRMRSISKNALRIIRKDTVNALSLMSQTY
jgi:hypothetical protein